MTVKITFELILADTNPEVCVAFRSLFRHRLVSVEEGDLTDIAADAYVSPANSHGIMDGGLDRVFRSRFPGIEAKVQQSIDQLGGKLPVGRALVVETDDSDVPYLICAPTMSRPSSLSGTRNVHAAMFAILQSIADFNSANETPIQSVAIPGLGTGVGRLAPDAAVAQIKAAFEQFLAEVS